MSQTPAIGGETAISGLFLIAAERNVGQQTAALPRPNQDAANFGLDNGPIKATPTARPESFSGRASRSKQPNDPPGAAGEIPVVPNIERIQFSP